MSERAVTGRELSDLQDSLAKKIDYRSGSGYDEVWQELGDMDTDQVRALAFVNIMNRSTELINADANA